MNRLYIYILLSFLTAQFETDARMIGFSSAYTTVAKGYQAIGVNPANLSTSQSLSLNLISVNAYAYNNFMSVTLYNDVSGADFENNGPDYLAKDDLLSYI